MSSDWYEWLDCFWLLPEHEYRKIFLNFAHSLPSHWEMQWTLDTNDRKSIMLWPLIDNHREIISYIGSFDIPIPTYATSSATMAQVLIFLRTRPKREPRKRNHHEIDVELWFSFGTLYCLRLKCALVVGSIDDGTHGRVRRFIFLSVRVWATSRHGQANGLTQMHHMYAHRNSNTLKKCQNYARVIHLLYFVNNFDILPIYSSCGVHKCMRVYNDNAYIVYVVCAKCDSLASVWVPKATIRSLLITQQHVELLRRS